TTVEMARVAAEIVGRTLGASRSGFGLLSQDGESVEVETDWAAAGFRSVVGRHRFADYGRLADDLRAGRPVIIEDVETDPRTADNPRALVDLGIRALLNMVVVEHGRPVALFFVHSEKPTSWRPEIVTFLRNVADRVENGVARLRAEDQQRV